MALTPSNMLPLGTVAPEFKLLDTIDDTHKSLDELVGDNGTLIMFICNHCPFVIHVNKELVKLANDYINQGIKCIAISSNDMVNYPQDRPELMKKKAKELKYPFPYLYDETQEVAKAYDAACTPDFFLFNKNLELVYTGQLDDSRPGNGIPVTGKDLRSAIESLINKRSINPNQKPSMGCNIKWKK
jgi:peroxiredoxin